MIFKVDTAGRRYDEPEERKRLGKLGFIFKHHSDGYFKNSFTIENKGVININSIEELMLFIKEYGAIVLSEKNITIYDDYLE